MSLANRVATIKPSPTLEITAKAKAMQAQGLDIVGFGAGEPDFDTPEFIKDAAIAALKAGFTKYTPAGGTDELKKAIIDKLKNENGLDYTPGQIIVSGGAKHCLYNLAQVLFQAGDEVLVPAPYWVSYPPQVELAEATPVIVNADEKEDFKVTISALEKCCTHKTKALILNSPSNPTGAAYTKEELIPIAEFALKRNIYLISDEIYESIVYDGFKPVSIACLSNEVKAKTIVVNGVSKTYSMTGWRIGYAAGSAEMIGAMTNIQSQSLSNPTSISQKASVAAMNGPKDFIEMMVKEFQKRRDYIVRRLNAIQGISCYNPKGAFYAFPKVSGLYGKRSGSDIIQNSLDFTSFLLKEALVAVVPGMAFGADDYVRLSFATSMASIEKGLDRIEASTGKLV